MKLFKTTIIFIIFIIIIPQVSADRGIIPVRPGISVYEPGQKAIVAWNGIEEILILSTDVKSDEDTIAIEILPLPSKPIIQKAEFKAFEELQKIIINKAFEIARDYGKSLDDVKSLEIIFREKIGVHDITIIKALNAKELTYWIEDYLKKNNIAQKLHLKSFEDIIQDYINRGFQYYAIDLITISKTEKSVKPILYKFNTSFLYYPLKISSILSGRTQITIFTITKERIKEGYSQFQKAYYIGPGIKQPIEFQISKLELNKIDARISELFNENVWLTVLEYKGNLNELNRDLIISMKQLKVSVPTHNILIIMTTLITTLIIMKKTKKT